MLTMRFTLTEKSKITLSASVSPPWSSQYKPAVEDSLVRDGHQTSHNFDPNNKKENKYKNQKGIMVRKHWRTFFFWEKQKERKRNKTTINRRRWHATAPASPISHVRVRVFALSIWPIRLGRVARSDHQNPSSRRWSISIVRERKGRIEEIGVEECSGDGVLRSTDTMGLRRCRLVWIGVLRRGIGSVLHFFKFNCFIT